MESWQAFDELDRGNLGPIRALQLSGALAVAQRLTERALGIDHPGLSPEDQSLLATDVDAKVRALRAVAHGQLLELDGDGLRKTAEQLAATDTALPRLQRRIYAAVAWADLIDGSEASRRWMEDAAELEQGALADQDAAMVVEFGTLRALAHLHTGDPDDGIAHARRVSRMARTESLPVVECLANLVLARARRMRGRSFLATRILDGLIAVAPPVWRPWLDWERRLSGDLPVGSGYHWDFLTRLSAAAQAGEREAFHEQQAGGLDRLRGVPLLAHEFATLGALLDPNETSMEQASPWKRGLSDTVPFGLDGGRGPSQEEGTGEVAGFVVAGPGRSPIRVLHGGYRLADPSGDSLLLPPKRKAGRIDSLLSILLLHGDAGAAIPEVFGQVYGFSYHPEKHGGPLRVLIHRLRAHLGDRASLERDGENLRLIPTTLLTAADPRTLRSAGDVMLQMLAENRSLSAKELARNLRASVRATQVQLEQLIEEGCCARLKDGRAVAYKVEDTTFREPTVRTGLRNAR